MYKRLFCLILALLMIGLCACEALTPSESTNPSTTTPSSSNAPSSSSSVASSTAPTTLPTTIPTSAPTTAPTTVPTTASTAAPTTQSTAKPTTPPATGSRDPLLAPPTSFEGPSDFFNDAAFIGDSITSALDYQNRRTGELGSPLFLNRPIFGLNNYKAAVNKNEVNDHWLPLYKGEEMFPEDALADAGVKKVFIMLGMNDIGYTKPSRAIELLEVLITRIKEKNPDMVFYLQSCTPIYTEGQTGGLTNKRMDEYNVLLEAYAAENGYYYIDVASYMKDGTNGLAPKYCSDKYVHLNTTGAAVWMQVLKAYIGH